MNWKLNSSPSQSEPLARYIYSKSGFSNDRVKFRAFMPPPNVGRLEVSVFRIIHLSSEGIMKLSGKARQDKKPKAVAHHIVKHIHENNLKLELDNNSERHANIIGWPKEKFEQQDIARKIAEKAKLEKYN